jgi:hypothetical protein
LTGESALQLRRIGFDHTREGMWVQAAGIAVVIVSSGVGGQLAARCSGLVAAVRLDETLEISTA